MRILDCTIRDGGYVVQWNFSDQWIRAYLEQVAPLVDIVEMGYLRNLPEFKLPARRTFKTAAMIDVKRYAEPDQIVVDTGRIDILRLAFHKADLAKASRFCRELKVRYPTLDLAANLMATGNYSRQELAAAAGVLAADQADILYVADSYGCLQDDQLTAMLTTVRAHFPGHVGIHLHNNLQNAVSNLDKQPAHLFDIVDSTLFGMGRGAGNLPTELLFVSEPDKLVSLLEFVCDWVISKRAPPSWGYHPDYVLAGALQIHPNYVAFFRGRSTKACMRCLLQVRKDGMHQYFDAAYAKRKFS